MIRSVQTDERKRNGIYSTDSPQTRTVIYVAKLADDAIGKNDYQLRQGRDDSIKGVEINVLDVELDEFEPEGGFNLPQPSILLREETTGMKLTPYHPPGKKQANVPSGKGRERRSKDAVFLLKSGMVDGKEE